MSETMYVTTDADLWNSADDAHFFVRKGDVKPLPEQTTPIIEDALDQGLLREATSEEKKKYLFGLEVEEAVKSRKMQPGKTWGATVESYNAYKKSIEPEIKKVVKKEEVEKPKEEVEKPKEEVIPLEKPKEEKK